MWKSQKFFKKPRNNPNLQDEVVYMKLNFMNLLYALSDALDMVEHNMTGVQSAHGKHVAYISYLMAKKYGMKGDELEEFTGCALLHDNAFTEYVREELMGGSAVDASELKRRIEILDSRQYMDFISHSAHSVMGEKNISLLPFRTDIKDIILYHHENADGTGPMRKMSYQTNLKSQIVHLADMFDLTCNIMTMNYDDFCKSTSAIRQNAGKYFSGRSVELFVDAVSYEDICYLQDYSAEVILRKELPSKNKNYTEEEIKNIAAFFARIVDCKSSFIRNHSFGVAEKVGLMGKFYGFSDEKCTRLYLAGALHDIGKLIIDNDVLEKTEKLSESEYSYVKTHVDATYQVLRKAKGLSDVTAWASRHHEKLNGSGYPHGLFAKDLSHEERLMTCCDIYQALTEDTPYKKALSHKNAISVMRDMVTRGEIDSSIVSDMDSIFGI